MQNPLTKMKNMLKRVLGREHKNIYNAAKEYADIKGLKIGDVVAAATAAYLTADDEEGKDLLEEQMTKSSGRRGRGGGIADLKQSAAIFKEMIGMTAEMFKAMNAARADASLSGALQDFRAVTNFANEVKREGAEKGSGSFDDQFAQAIVGKMLGSITQQRTPMQQSTPRTANPINVVSKAAQKKAGTAPVETVDDDK